MGTVSGEVKLIDTTVLVGCDNDSEDNAIMIVRIM